MNFQRILIIGLLFCGGCGGSGNTVVPPVDGGLTEAQINRLEPKDEIFGQAKPPEEGSKR